MLNTLVTFLAAIAGTLAGQGVWHLGKRALEDHQTQQMLEQYFPETERL